MAERCKSGARETKASTHPASLPAAVESDGAGGDVGIKGQGQASVSCGHSK